MENTTFRKRLRVFNQCENDENVNPLNNFSIQARLFRDARSSLNSSSPLASNGNNGLSEQVDYTLKGHYGDRYVPLQTPGDMRSSYSLMNEQLASPRKKKRKLRRSSEPFPDPTKDQANKLYNSVLHSELATSQSYYGPIRPTVSQKSAKRRRLLTYSSELATPPRWSSAIIPGNNNASCSTSPVCLDTHNILTTPIRQPRYIQKTPFRILDAPDLADDFYLSLVDWSSANLLGVGLGESVYTWNADTSRVSRLCSVGTDMISSVSWASNGSTLAVGTFGGQLRVYDAVTQELLRFLPEAHELRIGSVDWVGSHILSTGSRDGMIHHWDIRTRSTDPFSRGKGHKYEVCGLKWSGDDIASDCLASGGNDNKVCIWDLRGSKRAGVPLSQLGSSSSSIPRPQENANGDVPLWKFHNHTAAVKALAWSPHVKGLLATGGGARDKHIQFWNTISGKMVSEFDSGSQVCNLRWSPHSQELVSTHGLCQSTQQYHIYIWRYPAVDLVASLTGHTNRVVYLSMSPDGETIVTGSGDRTLRFWNVFPKPQSTERKEESVLEYGKLIR